MIPVFLEYRDERIFFHFQYSKPLIEEIKTSFEGRKWHGFDEDHPQKLWSVPITQRNLFVLEFLKGKYGINPYSRWDSVDLNKYKEVEEYCQRYERPVYKHQIDLIVQGLSVKWFLWASEMGTGKTLAAIVLMELSGYCDWFWVGPKSALRAVQMDMRKWKAQVQPQYFTYEGLKKLIQEWKGGEAPHGIIFDESIRLKTPTAQRSVAAKHIANSMRQEYGSNCLIGLMSGAPATKSPADWWNQCEIACPGYLREKDIITFRQRLALIEQREQLEGGGVYPHLVTWKDSSDKCAQCGQLKDHENHQADDFTQLLNLSGSVHKFVPGENEVAKLYKRMKGLVIVKLKKDCLDLPDKVYEIARVEPAADTLRAAKLIVTTSRRAIEALTKLRELSDGFQYLEAPVGRIVCPNCNGTGRECVFYDPKYPDNYVDPDAVAVGVRFLYDDAGEQIGQEPITYEQRVEKCTRCLGELTINQMERTTVEVPCPKDDIILEQLDLHDDVGRLNIYAGFTGSVDRIIKLCMRVGWGVIRADGRGWASFMPDGKQLPNDRLLDIYSEGQTEYPRLAFVAQAGAAGMGLTLVASPTTVFYSNDFNGDSRIQAEDRGHRIGMDRERGGRILDIFHLPSDEYVLNNLQKKKDLQHLSLTGVATCLNI